MKEVIKSVLEKFGTQTNLGSESARERIADEIEKALEQSDNYLYEDQGDGHMIKVDSESDSWKCEICNKSTYDLDYDYIGTGTNHLSCELKQEELQEKSDKIMKKLDKDFKDYDLSKAESNENSKVDMSNNEQTEIEFTEE